MSLEPAPSPQSPARSLAISWDQFHRDARVLAGRLADAGPFDAIVCITRGGLVPAAIVARELGIRLIDTIGVASYDHTRQGEARLIKSIGPDLAARNGGRGRGLLVIDDLADTGVTIELVRDLLPEAHIAVVYAKPKGRSLVDTFITEVTQDTWIYFPWDTGLEFRPPLRDGGA